MSARFLYTISLFFLLFGCQQEEFKSNVYNTYHLIPQPTMLKAQSGVFKLDGHTTILADTASAAIADYLNKTLQASVKGLSPLRLVENLQDNTKSIILQLDSTLQATEGYTLTVNDAQITLRAKASIGLFYGVQTLRQLLTDNGTILNIEIEDAPRFSYRGMHLDVGRHFFDVKTVKAFIDQLAYHKMNRFHWHLTEDQGWRIEIKKYSKLQEIAAFRDSTLIGRKGVGEAKYDGKRYGGYYTQEEIKEVVAYATERFITVIPEIELPGHAQAAIAAYPELGCTNKQLEVMQTWGVSQNVYCPTEKTFEFLEDVLTEVMALFPSKYIHIGGDECPKKQWEESTFCQKLMKKQGLKDEHELQSYFIGRIEQFLNANGRQIIGWDEILEGGLAPNATVMSWRGMAGGIEAAKAKHDVIMTPTSHCYFDYYQSKSPDEPLAIGGFLPLQKVYALEPVPKELTPDEAQYILGAQGNIWTEYISTPEYMQYMAFPRLCALAEVVWSSKSQRDFEDFVTRLMPHIDRLENMGVHVAKHFHDIEGNVQPNDGQLQATLSTLAKDATIHYTLNGDVPSLASSRYNAPISINTSGTLKAQSFQDGKAVGAGYSIPINMHKAIAKQLRLQVSASTKYNGGGRAALLNGILGDEDNFNDGNWNGFEGEHLAATIDLGKITEVQQVTLRFFKAEEHWIYLPKTVEILTSEDGENFKSVTIIAGLETPKKIAAVQLPVEASTRYLKVKAENHGTIGEGKAGAGNAAWLFVDEIQVN